MTGVRLEGLRSAQELAEAARSACYGWLAQAFAFPTPELTAAVASGRIREELDSAAADLPFPVAAGDEMAADPSATHEEMQEAYIRLFEVGPGHPPCPLYEGSHRRGRPKIMEELVRFYEHFGLRHQEGDLPDHVCAELEFMHYLAFKQAAARRAGTDGEPYRLAQRDFLARHLNRWLPKLRARMEQLDPPPFYLSLARLAEEVCHRDFRFLEGGGVKPDTLLRSLPD